MTLWTDLFPDEAILLGRTWQKLPGQFNLVVPTTFGKWPGKSAAYCRAHVMGCGGTGQYWGGSGARARGIFTVTPGETLLTQIGVTSTASTPGDTWVKRNNGTLLLYADRGRGNGTQGLASNSFGDETYDGQPGNNSSGTGGGLNDLGEYAEILNFAARGSDYQFTRASDPGGGGKGAAVTDPYSNVVGHTGWYGGQGIACYEWFNSNPNY